MQGGDGVAMRGGGGIILKLLITLFIKSIEYLDYILAY